MWQAERLLLDLLGDGPATNALGADQFGGVRAIGQGDPQTLEVWLELPPRDAGDLGANTAEILLLTADRHRVPHRETLAADFTAPCHYITLRSV